MTRFSAQALSVCYGAQQRLWDVDLPEIVDGQVVGLLGPNAAGKSTLLRALAGLSKYRGVLSLDGQSHRQLGKKAWSRAVAYMPQTAPQATSLTPYELLWSAAKALDIESDAAALAANIEALCSQLGLASEALQPLAALSGGKRQLVGLALSLMRDPEVLLLDEPTSALDLHWRMVVLDLVSERVKQRGGIVLVALHDLELAARYCQQLVFLEQGRVIEAGPTQEVLTAAILARAFRVEAQVERGEQGMPPRVHLLRPIRETPRTHP